uniref:Uncharacterized protein n=1 Tax=Streptomyces sp. L-49973 TaxID=762837 RepID=E0WFL2_9ACTN|nr:hypothetical protein [Streptomyces sp. L-49973]
MPDIKTLLAGLFAGGPDLGVRSVAEGAVVQLCAPNGRPLVSVEAPLLVQVPGEAQRLLGADVSSPEVPYWWTEARATTAVEEGERLAGSFAGRVATVLGGTVWPPEAAHTEVVPLTSEAATAASASEVTPPAVDVLTDKAAVVMQDRPVIAMTSWLADALRTAAASDRALQIVTPPGTSLTLPTRNALHGHPNRWVVQDPDCGYYDGLSGAQLHWEQGHFTPAKSAEGNAPMAEAFKPNPNPNLNPTSASVSVSAATGERQLMLSLHTAHPADENLLLGGALEAAWRALTGTAPAGWSTAEPIALPWSRRQLTELARARAQRSAPTWLTAVGSPDRPAIATTHITHTSAGIEEHTTLTLGYATDEAPPLDTIAPLAETLATEHGLTSMFTTLRPARGDLTVPPRFEAPPVPLSFTLGTEAVSGIGLAHADQPQEGVHPVRLGPPTRPALHYVLGDGSDPQAWARFEQLTTRLGAG